MALKRNQMAASVQSNSTTRDAYAHCESLVRDAGKDRWLASLFAPAGARPHLHALHAFAGEIARVRAAARGEALPGEIRLQWWRDVLEGQAWGDASANPVAAALVDTVARCALPKVRLIAFIDAHAFDLYDDAMASTADLDAYAEHTSGTLFALAAHILGGKEGADASAAAAPVGIAWGVAQRLRSFPHDLAHRQMFVPLDLLAQHGVTRGEVEARHNTAGLRAALAALRAHARAAMARFAAAAPGIPEPCAPAFLLATLAPQLLAKLDAAAADPFAEVEAPQWRRQWALWRAARRWPMVKM
jgi:phytoene synthase